MKIFNLLNILLVIFFDILLIQQYRDITTSDIVLLSKTDSFLFFLFLVLSNLFVGFAIYLKNKKFKFIFFIFELVCVHIAIRYLSSPISDAYQILTQK